MSKAWQLLLVAAIGFLVLVARRPEALFRAEFGLEDGSVFYIGTYFGNPLEVLFRPYAGYLEVLPRMISYSERIVPVELAPLVGHLVCLSLIALLAAFIASDRLAVVVPDRRARLGLAALLILLPNVQENAGSVANIQWYIPVYLLALAGARPPDPRWGKVAELSFLTVISLTSPAAAVMQPLFWWRAWRQRDRYSLALVVVLAVGALAQVVTLAIDGRNPADLEMFSDLLRAWAYRLFVGGILGQTVAYYLAAMGLPSVLNTLMTLVLAVGLIFTWFLALSGWSRTSVAFVWIVFGLTPIMAQTEGAAFLANPYVANRYFMVPTAMVAIAVFAALTRLRRPPERWLALGMSILLSIAIGADMRLPATPSLDWATRSKCIGGPEPCVVPVYYTEDWSIHWPGSEGQYVQPRPGG